MKDEIEMSTIIFHGGACFLHLLCPFWIPGQHENLARASYCAGAE
jgi:hypothetical protein